MNKAKNFYILSSFILIPILFIGFMEHKVPVDYEGIVWSPDILKWDNFKEVDSLQGNYHASIYSEIFCPDKISKSNSEIYAYMKPEYSKKVNDSMLGEQLLIHEQYHFNITEYHARLLRKAVVKKGLKNLTDDSFTELFNMYLAKKDEMQNMYDSISKHNLNQNDQRFWELKTDNYLRETAYFENPDIYSYYSLLQKPTKYFRNIYYTFEYDILTSYPILENETKFGEAYKVLRTKNRIEVQFYKNGILENGGYFNTAVTLIENNSDGSKISYLNPDRSFNSKRNYAILKSFKKEGSKYITYYNQLDERIPNKDIYEVRWIKKQDDSFYSTYFNENGDLVRNKDLVWHERRLYDNKGRTILVESFDKKNEPMRDDDYGSTYKYSIDDNHKTLEYSIFDIDGSYAKYLDGYNFSYLYDERGNTKQIAVLDKNNQRIEDHDGIAIYKYTYDKWDNTVSTRYYNRNNIPVIGSLGYHEEVTDYDAEGRVVFEAKYYPEHVLVFTEDKWGASKYVYPNDSLSILINLDAFNNNFNDDSGTAKIKRTHNNEDLITESILLDINENFSKTVDGIVLYRFEYDENNNQISESTFDSIGNPKTFEEDVAKVNWEYDKNGNKLKTTYYNDQGALAYGNQNVTYNIFKYNNQGHFIERLNYDHQMNPENLDGVHKTVFSVDSKGNDTLSMNYDKSNKPIDLIPMAKTVYNDFDEVISVSYFTMDNNKSEDGFGVHRTVYSYDSQQQLLSTTYYDKNGFKTVGQEGYSYVVYTKNISGYLLTMSYYNKTDQPVLGPEGYHLLKYKWDETGELSSESKYDRRLKLKEDENGVALYEYTRFKSGLIKTIKSYNDLGKLTNDINGVAETRYSPNMNGLYYLDKEYDALGKEIIKTEQ